MTETAEQKARDMLERIGVDAAQSFSAGDLVELANLIAGVQHVPSTVTRVVLVYEGGFTEKWAKSWELHLQDDGRTLKLFPKTETLPAYEHTPGFFETPEQLRPGWSPDPDWVKKE